MENQNNILQMEESVSEKVEDNIEENGNDEKVFLEVFKKEKPEGNPKDETEKPTQPIAEDKTSDETAMEKLNRELTSIKEKRVPTEPIAKHLIEKCGADPEFAMRVMLENKQLKECFEYVYSEVRKKLSGVSGWISDEEVYKMAEQYYILDKVEIPETRQPHVENKTTVNKCVKPKINSSSPIENKNKKTNKNETYQFSFLDCGVLK